MNSAACAPAEQPAAAEKPSLWWGREMFRTPTGVCPPTIDITGPSRLLLFGPWAKLEPGRWRATVSLELCPEAARRRIAVDLGWLPEFTTVDIPPGVSGRQEIEIEAPIEEDKLAEVRIWLKAAAFHGELSFLGAKLERIGDLEPAHGPTVS